MHILLINFLLTELIDYHLIFFIGGGGGLLYVIVIGLYKIFLIIGKGRDLPGAYKDFDKKLEKMGNFKRGEKISTKK